MAAGSVRLNRAAGSNAGDAGESVGKRGVVFLEQDCAAHSRGLWKSCRALPEKILSAVGQILRGAAPPVRGRRPRRPFIGNRTAGPGGPARTGASAPPLLVNLCDA